MDFNEFDAMPISELFITKRIHNDSAQWKLFDAYKLNREYDIQITENGMIEQWNDGLHVVGADFSTARRQNLNGVNVTCGLVVIFGIYSILITFLDVLWMNLIYSFGFLLNLNVALKIAYPERFTYVEDPANNHVDVFTKASINLGYNLRENLNIRFGIFKILKKNEKNTSFLNLCESFFLL